MRLRLEAGALDNSIAVDGHDTSALGEGFDDTPLVVPVGGHLDSIKRLLKGDRYIGRGSRQRSLGKSRYCNTFKVSQYGRSVAISSFRDASLADSSPCLSMDFIRYATSVSLSPFRELARRHIDRRVQEILKSQKAKKVRVQTWVSLQRTLVTAVGVNP